MLGLISSLTRYLKLLQAEGKREVSISSDTKKIWKAYCQKISQSPPLQKTSSHTPSSMSIKKNPPEPAPPVADPPLKITVPAVSPITSLQGETKKEKLADLEKRVTSCKKCPHLASSRTQTVFGIGNPDSKIMFIGEAPGADEDEQGEPFVGRAGKLLTKMIVAMGLSREEVYIANALKCRPNMPEGATGNRKPTSEEMGECLPYVLTQIEIIRPSVIVALGSASVQTLTSIKTPMSKLRGNFLDFRGTPLMITFHPAYLLYNSSIHERRKVWEDLMKVMEKCKISISKKQRGFFLA